MSMTDAVRSVLKRYADFSGRSRRSEYWYWALAQLVLFAPLYAVAVGLTAGGNEGAGGAVAILLGITYLAVLVPSLAVMVRRLHDTGRSGWWYFISFVPLVGPVVLLVFTLLDSEPMPNRWGPSPKQPAY